MSSETPKRRGGRLLKIGAVLVILVVLLIALAPTLVSRGLGHGAIRSAIGQRISGVADFDGLRVGWSGPQRVEGLTIVDSTGLTAVDVDVTVNAGLLALIRGTYDPLEIDISGTLRGELFADGTTSFQRLSPDDDAPPEKPPRPGQEKAPLAGVPHVVLNVNDFAIELIDQASGRTIAVNDVTGNLAFEPGASARAKFTGKTVANDVEGAVEIDVELTNLFDANGALTPKGASARIEVTATSVALPFTNPPGELTRLRLSATGDDLGRRLEIAVEADAVIEGQSPSRLDGALSIARPFAEDGSPNLSLDAIEGTVTGTRVPTALIEHMLADTPIRALRDIGPVVDVSAEFPPIEVGAPRDVSVVVTGEHTQLSAAAQVDPDDGSVRGEHLRLVAHIDPALVAEVSDLTIDERAEVLLELDSFFLPGKGELRALSVTGRASLRTPVMVTGGGERPFELSLGATTLAVETAALSEGVRVQGTGQLDGATIDVNQRVTSLLDDDGQLAIGGARLSGAIGATDMPGATLAQFLPQSAINDEILAGDLTATLTTDVVDGVQTASIDLSGDRLSIKADVARRDDAVSVSSASGTVTLTPALAAALQEGSDDPIVLVEPATVSFSLEPFTTTGAETLRGRVEVERAVLANVAEGAEPIELRRVAADLTARTGDQPEYSASGTATVRRHKPGKPIARLTYAVTFQFEAEERLRSATIEATELSIVNLEQTLGNPRGTYSDWLGDTGEVSVFTGGEDASRLALNVSLPNLSGAFVVERGADVIDVSADGARMTLKQAALEKLLAPAQVHGDVPVAFTLETGRLPLAMLTGKPFDPSVVDLDARLTGGALAFTTPDGVRTSLQNLRVGVSSDDLADGVTFQLQGTAASDQAETAGNIDVDGKVTGLVDADSTFAIEDWVLHMTARGQSIPTIVPDALGQLDGLLVAAVGAQIDGEVKARNLSPNTGRLIADLESPNGSIKVRVDVADETYHISGDNPLRAQLAITSELGSRLLRNVHPLLADVRSSKDPVRAVVGNVTLPASKDVSGLNADIDIEIGEVEFDSGSLMLQLLQLAKTDNARTIPGYVEPIKARIRSGIVTYDRFAVRLDQFTLVYTGQIDLNTKQVDLRTELPLEALGRSVRELEGYVDGIVVPLVTRGKLGDLKTEIDPNFDLAGQAARAGVQGAIGELLKGAGAPPELGGLLGELLGGEKNGKKKKD